MTVPITHDKIQPAPLSHLGWHVLKAGQWADRMDEARRNAERSIASAGPAAGPERHRMIREQYRDEAALHAQVENLASQLIDAAHALGWGSGDPVTDAHDWLDRIAEERRFLAPPPEPAPPTRRALADRAIQKAFRRIGERDGFRCRTCGIDRTLTVDHVIAVANGGTDDDDNLQLLCRSHNSQKGTN